MLIHTVALRGVLAGVGLVAALSLGGCVSPGGSLVPTFSPAPVGPTTSPTPTVEPSPSGSAAPVEKPTPVSIPCNSVVDLQTMYDFNPNFGLLSKFSPDAGTPAAKAITDKGTACRWVNQTSGDTIDVSISRPGPTAFAAARGSAESGTPISGIGDAAYFSTSGRSGLIQAFDGPNLITVASVYLSSGNDASSIVRSAVSAAR